MLNVVSTTNLEKSYKGKCALKDCTIDVPAGSVVALVGPNGAGKTTLLDIMVDRPVGAKPFTNQEKQLACEQGFKGSHA